MTVYVAAATRQFGPYLLQPGDEVPEEILANLEPDTWVRQGHFLKLDGDEARSLRTARQKLDEAQLTLVKSQNAYNEKLIELSQRKDD